MIRQGATLLAVLAAVTAVSASADEAAWPRGIYSSVQVSEETGDAGGLELRFFMRAGRPMVETVLCESVCERSYTVQLERTANGYAFSYVEIREGSPDEPLRVLLRPEGGALRARLTAQSDPHTPLWAEDALLTRRRTPLGLVGVNGGSE